MTNRCADVDKRLELTHVAMAIINGEMDLIVGARRICGLRYELGDPDDEVFLPIRGFESETDNFPVGEERERYGDEYLKRLDYEAARYVAEAKDSVIDA